MVTQHVRCGWTQLALISRIFTNEITSLSNWETYARAERVVIRLGIASEDSVMAMVLCTNTVNDLRKMGNLYICYQIWQVSSEEFEVMLGEFLCPEWVD